MNIILSNDDGIASPGLRALCERLAKRHDVLVVAPAGERSAASHSLTLRKPMKLAKGKGFPFGVAAYALDGSPADCVKFSICRFTDFRPDAVVAGINLGSNLGTDVLYSGTVSCAREAAACGVAGIAVSLGWGGANRFGTAADFIADNLERLIPLCAPGSFLNVNVPDVEKSGIAGVRVAPLGVRAYTDIYRESRKRGCVEAGGVAVRQAANPEDCDTELAERNFITVTPLLVDATDYARLAELREKAAFI